MSQSDQWRTVWARFPEELTPSEIAVGRAQTVEQDPAEQNTLLEAERRAYAERLARSDGQ